MYTFSIAQKKNSKQKKKKFYQLRTDNRTKIMSFHSGTECPFILCCISTQWNFPIPFLLLFVIFFQLLSTYFISYTLFHNLFRFIFILVFCCWLPFWLEKNRRPLRCAFIQCPFSLLFLFTTLLTSCHVFSIFVFVFLLLPANSSVKWWLT